MQHFWQNTRTLLLETFKEWQEDNAANVAASLAYYAIFSLSPLLIILALVLGLLIGNNAAESEVLGGVESIFGQEGVNTLDNTLAQSDSPQSRGNIFSVLLWFAVVFWGVSGLFTQLQRALNIIWEVRLSADAHRLVFLKNRLLSFGVVMVGSFLLVVSTFANAAISQLDVSGREAVIIRLLQASLTFTLITVLIAAIYKILPDVIIAWRDVWVGALFSAFLVMVGQLVVGIYISNSNIGSVYGAAGSLTIILVWIYYSAQTFLFGAEFTEVWARHHGASITPDADAEWIDPVKAARELENAQKIRAERNKQLAEKKQLNSQ